MKIKILTVPHDKQRYNTCGDYYFDKDVLHIKVSNMSDWRYELLVAIHELIEFSLTKHQGVSISTIDEFDTTYEQRRKANHIDYQDEPGNHPSSPYLKEHQFASAIEKLVAVLLEVNWADYESEADNLT